MLARLPWRQGREGKSLASIDSLTDDCKEYVIQAAPCSTRLALAAASSCWHALVWAQETLWLKVTFGEGVLTSTADQPEYDRLADALVSSLQLPEADIQHAAPLLQLLSVLLGGPVSRVGFLGVYARTHMLAAGARLCNALFSQDARIVAAPRMMCSDEGPLPPDMHKALRLVMRTTAMQLSNWSLPQGRLQLEGLLELVIDSPAEGVIDDWPDLLTRVLALLPTGLRRLVAELPLNDDGDTAVVPDTPGVREAWVRVAPTLEHLVLHADSYFSSSFAALEPAMKLGWKALKELHVPGSGDSAVLHLVHSACGGSLEAFSDAMPCLHSLGGLEVQTREMADNLVPNFVSGLSRQRAYLRDKSSMAVIGLRGLSCITRPLPRLRVVHMHMNCTLCIAAAPDCDQVSDGYAKLEELCTAVRLLPQVRHFFIHYYSEELIPLVDVARALASLQGICLPGFESERRSIQFLRTDCNSCGFCSPDGEPLSERECNALFRLALPGLEVRVRYVDPDEHRISDRSGESALANRLHGDDFPLWPQNACAMLPCPALKTGR